MNVLKQCVQYHHVLPVAKIVAWAVLEQMHVDHWWNDSNR